VSRLDEMPPDRLPVSRDAAEVAIDHLGIQSAMALVAGLPPLQAEAILLRVVAGLDTDTVAQLVSRRPGAVTGRMTRRSVIRTWLTAARVAGRSPEPPAGHAPLRHVTAAMFADPVGSPGRSGQGLGI
jgi:hypothetical protein